MFPLLLLALDLAGLAPRALQKTGVQVARHGEAAAVVDREAALWVGEGRLKKVASLAVIPDGIALGDDGLALWSLRREGLWTETRLERRGLDGALLDEAVVQGPALFGVALEDGFAVALPGQLALLREQGLRLVALPVLLPELVTEAEGTLLVRGGDQRASVDLETGCARAVEPGPSALEAWLVARAEAACDPRAARPELAVDAEAARAAAIRGAVAARSPGLLAGLGVLGREAVLALAPRADGGKGRFTTLSGDVLPGRPGLFGAEGAVLVQDVDDDLEGWAEGEHAPACHARLLLVGSTPGAAARNRETVAARRRAGDDCADQIVALQAGELVDTVAGPTLRFSSPRGDLLARRVGPLGPAQVRLDIASLTPRGDALTALGQLPSYNSEWMIPAARAAEIALDVDGSAIIAAGWDLVRVDPSGRRVARLALPGPVGALGVRTNGTIDAVVGGQRAVVDLDDQQVRWFEAAPGASPSPPVRERGPWSVEGGQLWRAGADGQRRRIALAVPALDVAAAGSGAVVETALGLFGLDAEGKPSWKLPDAGAWAVSRGVLIVGTAAGVAGYRLPR